MMTTSSRGIDRRAFLKSAVAIGGASALAACLDRETDAIPRGTDDPSTLPRRQHAWNDVLARDAHGNVLTPRHHVLLHLDYAESGTPADADRAAVDDAFRSLERAYEWSNRGLVFTVGYSPAYFDRFDGRLPDSVDLPPPDALAPFEDPALDTPDAIVHLASDRASAVLAAEQALRGETDTLNGVAAAPLPDAITVVDRRTGFVGAGLPAAHQDVDGVPADDPVPEEAPLYMGFTSGFEKNQASEDRVTIGDGPFAGGTTMHASHMFLDLEQWYGQDDRYHRVATMFCPHHAQTDAVEGVGTNLGTDSGMDDCADPAEAARTQGVVGHSQKLTTVREDDAPLMVRRDFDSTDGDRPGLHFVAVQETISDFVDTRRAMNGEDLAAESAVGQRTNNGILQYIDVTRRGNYLLPPRPLRALPRARPEVAQ
jgi:hypothetical protein